MSKISEIKALAFQLAPRPLQRKVLTYAEDKKTAHWQECFKTKVSLKEVEELFSRMEIESDVMIHSSLPDIGNIKLSHVTSSLKYAILDKGYTILCPALPIKGSSLDYLKSIKEFDVRTAPNAMGAISSYYGRKEGAKRSLSPTHSVIAFGNQANYYTCEHHLDETPFTHKSPYYKIIETKGKILMFGASLKNLTFNHIIEDMIGEEAFPVQVYDPQRFKIDLIDESGNRTAGVFRAHSRKSGRLRDSSELMEQVRRLPSTHIYSLGCGEVIILDARDVCICLLNGLKKGNTTMGHRRVSDACKEKADYWINYIQEQ